MKAYGGVEIKLCSFLASALHEVQWSHPWPGRFISRLKKKAPIPTESETGWAPEPVWMQSIRETCVADARKQAMIRFFSLQRSHYAGWAIVALLIQSNYKPQEQEQAGTQTGVPMSWQFALTNGSLFLRLTQTQGQAACLSNSSRSSPVCYLR